MSEYFIKFEAVVGGILGFPHKIKGSEIYEADTAKEAREKAIEEYKANMAKELIPEDEVSFAITEIKKL